MSRPPLGPWATGMSSREGIRLKSGVCIVCWLGLLPGVQPKEPKEGAEVTCRH